MAAETRKSWRIALWVRSGSVGIVHADFADFADWGSMLELNEISRIVIGSAFQIHTELGPCLFESVYEVILADDLPRKGLHTERQKRIPIKFRGRTFPKAFRVDLLVEGELIVEVKSVPMLTRVDFKQMTTYLRLLPSRLGLILNFGADSLVIKRMVNGL